MDKTILDGRATGLLMMKSNEVQNSKDATEAECACDDLSFLEEVLPFAGRGITVRTTFWPPHRD
jgi:hypothetical protein